MEAILNFYVDAHFYFHNKIEIMSYYSRLFLRHHSFNSRFSFFFIYTINILRISNDIEFYSRTDFYVVEPTSGLNEHFCAVEYYFRTNSIWRSGKFLKCISFTGNMDKTQRFAPVDGRSSYVHIGSEIH